jgi:threonine dehydrogenase-like Zn-dependent dehydrogenase
MKATIMYGAGDVRVENIPDPAIIEPTDAVIRVVRACICGSELWPYTSMAPSNTGQSTGHEAIGVVEEIGGDVRTVKRGDVVVTPRWPRMICRAGHWSNTPARIRRGA